MFLVHYSVDIDNMVLFQTQIQCFAMVRLEIGLGHFKATKVLFGALVLTPMLCVLPLVPLTFQRMVLTLKVLSVLL